MKRFCAILALFCLIGCENTVKEYSNGSRVGVVTKLSYKGEGKKTWEGELAMASATTQGGPATDKTSTSGTWQFSVEKRHPEIVAKLKKAMRMASQVECAYSQRTSKTDADGTTYMTDYRVTDVHAVAGGNAVPIDVTAADTAEVQVTEVNAQQ